MNFITNCNKKSIVTIQIYVILILTKKNKSLGTGSKKIKYIKES